MLVKSKINEGTTLTIKLPSAPSIGKSHENHSLLIVDDEKEILRSLTLTFMQDYEIFTTSSGIEALDILAKQDIALILADQRMPEMTGVELLAKKPS